MPDIATIPQRYDEAIPIDSLRPHPKNPKLHDDAVIDEGLDALGFFGAVYVQEGTSIIIAGHGRVERMKAKGATTIPGFWMDVDDDTAEKIMLIDNEASRRAGFDEGLLADLLRGRAEAGDLYGTGYTADALDDLLARQDDFEILPPEDFQGGYAETPDEQAARAAKPATTKAASGLREVVLVYPDDVYDELQRDLRTIKEFHSADSASDTVRAAVTQYAQSLRSDFPGQ